jgi:succinate dehydrogenase / fumarate reductase iron-sulfur subunit
MKITLRIQRFNPETDKEAYDQDFEVEVEPTDRLLDALMYVKRNVDASLGVRKSCAHGVCGSDAMIIEGKERLACKTLVKDVAGEEGAVVTVRPLRSMPVQRDLLVDQEGFFAKYRAVKPYLIRDAKAPQQKEHLQAPDERQKIEDQTKCILCSACYSSCPVVAESSPEFIGPAAVVQAARFVFDSRDDGLEERLDVLDGENGVWPCENHFNCTKVCPRGIKVTKHINLTKRKIKAFKEEQDQAT